MTKKEVITEVNAQNAEKESNAQQKKEDASGLKNEYILAAALVLILAVAAFYFIQLRGDGEVQISEFKKIVNATTKAAVIQDLRGIPHGDSNASAGLMNCGIQLSYALSLLGKNVTNYAFEGNNCYGGISNSPRTPEECNREIERDGRLKFTLAFNATQNKTLLTSSGARYSGDTSFLSDCTVTSLVR